MSISVCLPPAKNFFRVAFRSGGQLQMHCFQARDAFNKQQWLNCIRQAKEALGSTESDPQTAARCSDCSADASAECPQMDLTDLTLTPVKTWATLFSTVLQKRKHFSETEFCVILCLAFTALLFVAIVQKLSIWVQRFTLILLSATEMHYCLCKKTVTSV